VFFLLRLPTKACFQEGGEKGKQRMRQQSVLVLFAKREQGVGERSEHPAQLHFLENKSR
jgi:hypothetical protein